MKYISYAMFFLCFSDLNAQDLNFKNRPTISDEVKNKSIIINDMIFDYRILKHYNKESLQQMSLVKLKQIHFLYTESYTVIDSEDCKDFKNVDIDIAKIEIYRQENESTIIDFGENCKLHIKLISKTALKEKFNSL